MVIIRSMVDTPLDGTLLSSNYFSFAGLDPLRLDPLGNLGNGLLGVLKEEFHINGSILGRFDPTLKTFLQFGPGHG